MWSPLDSDLLSGKYRRGQETKKGCHLGDWDESPVREEEKLYDTIKVLVEIANEYGVSVAQASLARLVGGSDRASVIMATDREPGVATKSGNSDFHCRDVAFAEQVGDQ